MDLVDHVVEHQASDALAGHDRGDDMVVVEHIFVMAGLARAACGRRQPAPLRVLPREPAAEERSVDADQASALDVLEPAIGAEPRLGHRRAPPESRIFATCSERMTFVRRCHGGCDGRA
jgi:hypothetical protein